MKAAKKSREANRSTYLADLHLGHRKQSGGNGRQANNGLKEAQRTEMTTDWRLELAVTPRENLSMSAPPSLNN
jgi:hypothetical protein